MREGSNCSGGGGRVRGWVRVEEGEAPERRRRGGELVGAAVLFSGDSSHGDKRGPGGRWMWCGNINIDKPVTG